MIEEIAEDRLEDLCEAVDYAVVGPRDNRVHEVRTREHPFNTICHVERDFGVGRWLGCSAALIDPGRVLTAGHCVYSHRLGRAPRRIRVIPGRADRDTMPYGSIVSSEYYAPRRYVRAGDPFHPDRRDFDYGIIILPEPLRRILRFMTVRALPDARLGKLKHQRLITIAGYPADRPIGTLWRHTERLKGTAPRRLFYSVDTCPGHSGSPIWYRDGDARHIVGVHTSGILDEQGRPFGCMRGTVLAPPGMVNSGVRITRELIAHLRDPIRAAAAGDGLVRLP